MGLQVGMNSRMRVHVLYTQELGTRVCMTLQWLSVRHGCDSVSVQQCPCIHVNVRQYECETG